jgi:pyrroline-5-carboxylate reductase
LAAAFGKHMDNTPSSIDFYWTATIMTTAFALAPDAHIAFIGGGNMATALIGGLLRQGLAAGRITVVEPWDEAQHKLMALGLRVLPSPSSELDRASLVIWAVKPQTFKEAALNSRFHTRNALHLSVAAGIRSDSIAHWLGTERIVRAMPNTPALVGKGMTGLFARAGATAGDRATAERIIEPTGASLWVSTEPLLDAVTALSGSGPAYVFYFIECMAQAGTDMGLSREQAHQLAIGTFVGASELARSSDEAPAVLRQRVTSKGGTTHAAITSLEQDQVRSAIERAVMAARHRARELGDEFGGN